MDVILDIIDRIMDCLSDLLLRPLLTDPMYRRGFASAIVVGFTLNKLLSRFFAARALIMAFFQPSAMPASRPGPSGADRARGCGYGIVRLIILGGFLLLVFVAVAIAFSR